MTVTVGITGGTGFIGEKIIDILVEADAQVISLQRSERGGAKVPVRIFDLSNLNTINAELLEGIDVVIHTAALVHNSSANQTEHEMINRYATSKLISVSMQCNIKKFIFISTVGVYGVSSQTSTICLETPVSPETPYAKAKCASEIELLKDACSEMKISIFRLPLVIGKKMHLEIMDSWKRFPSPKSHCHLA
jgi:nucleoside-diphosphate-sugar epimerase